MSRYIDAEVALQSFCAECNHKIKCEDCDIKYHLETFVPTADVQEIKRGRWEKAYLGQQYAGCNPTMLYCSACQRVTAFETRYCPNCGAKMEEVEE